MTVNNGHLSGKGTIGSETSRVTVKADGTIDRITNLEADVLTNEGTVTAENVTVKTGTNTGDLTVAAVCSRATSPTTARPRSRVRRLHPARLPMRVN